MLSNGQHLTPNPGFEKPYGERYLQGELKEDEVKKIPEKSEDLIQYFLGRCFNQENGEIDASTD